MYTSSPHQSPARPRASLFFKNFIDRHKKGVLLLPMAGLGGEAIYAARKGWEVEAWDTREAFREKALTAAREEEVTIKYNIRDVADFRAGKLYDAIALMYVHLPPALRRSFHEEVYKSLRPGGFLLLEAFAREQANYGSGGPRDANLLYDAPSLCTDFRFLHLLNCEQTEIWQYETRSPASVLHLLGQRL